jgi:hypothetical protein
VGFDVFVQLMGVGVAEWVLEKLLFFFDCLFCFNDGVALCSFIFMEFAFFPSCLLLGGDRLAQTGLVEYMQ